MKTAPPLTGLAAAAAFALAGCSSLRGNQRDLASIEDVAGPIERNIRTVAYETPEDLAARRSDPRLTKARELFEAGRYGRAEDAFDAVVKAYRPEFAQRVFGNGRAMNWQKTADERAVELYGSPVEQEALFMLAECRLKQGKLPAAQETYDRLVYRYPATQYLSQVTRRQYQIARHWLGFPPAKAQGEGEIEQVVFEDVRKSADDRTAPRKTPWLNLSDRTRPTFDTTGRAIQALKSIWLNDPTGPLADDALMLTANHHFRSGDPVEAARYYELLREQFPDSPHLKSAYLLEGAVKQASYAGPTYDETALDEAQRLKQMSLQVFPDMTAEERAQLKKDLGRIETAKAAADWAQVEFYRRKNAVPSIRLYCNSLINEHPESIYADRARAMLAMLNGEERNGASSWPIKPVPDMATARRFRENRLSSSAIQMADLSEGQSRPRPKPQAPAGNPFAGGGVVQTSAETPAAPQGEPKAVTADDVDWFGTGRGVAPPQAQPERPSPGGYGSENEGGLSLPIGRGLGSNPFE